MDDVGSVDNGPDGQMDNSGRDLFLDDFWITRPARALCKQVDNVGIPQPLAEPQIGPCGVFCNQKCALQRLPFTEPSEDWNMTFSNQGEDT